MSEVVPSEGFNLGFIDNGLTITSSDFAHLIIPQDIIILSLLNPYYPEGGNRVESHDRYWLIPFCL